MDTLNGKGFLRLAAMNMSSTKIFLCLLCFALTVVRGQDHFTGFWEPELSVDYSVFQDYSHSNAVSSRLFFYEGSALAFRTRQLEISHFSDFRVRSNKSLAAGVMYRFRDTFEPGEGNELRLTEQYNQTGELGVFRTGHRFRLEQRFKQPFTEHRVRYRFAMDTPLSGQELNRNEAYLILNTESLLTLARGSEPSYDQRFETVIGWWVAEKMKFEMGLQYRIENFTRIPDHVLFLLSGVELSL